MESLITRYGKVRLRQNVELLKRRLIFHEELLEAYERRNAEQLIISMTEEDAEEIRKDIEESKKIIERIEAGTF